MQSKDSIAKPHTNEGNDIRMCTLAEVTQQLNEVEHALRKTSDLCASCPDLTALQGQNSQADVTKYYLELSSQGDLWKLLVKFDDVITALNAVTGVLQLSAIAKARAEKHAH